MRASNAVTRLGPGIVLLVCLCASGLWAQGSPDIGYLYPAGGQRGTTFRVLAGGQNLRQPESVLVSGEGVSGTVVEWAPPLLGNNRGIVSRHLRALIKFRTAELAAKKGAGQPPDPAKLAEERAKIDPLPDHPLCRNLEQMSIVELSDLAASLYNPKEQPNTQLGETVFLDLTIAPDAEPGDRELRIITRSGITNPMIFQVGLLPEALEQEPNDPAPSRNPRIDALREQPRPLTLPVLLNGQIMPGDVDRFRLIAQQGDRLVVQVQARHLVPYLADAVPGWFQATVALFDASGVELAFADEYLFNPDPVLYYVVPATGEYILEVRDAIYRGRQDFVYRISVGEQPFIRWIFPLGGGPDGPTTASVGGWHLPTDRVTLGTEGMPSCIREAQWSCDAGLCNHVLYAVDTLPQITDSEPNDGPADAQMIVLPVIINGRIERPGDVDWFTFQGRAGENIVAEVYGRRLRSPIDSILRLHDATGAVLDWNDDLTTKDGDLHTGPGLLTHYADSCLRVTLPADGDYFFQIADTQGQGGEEWGYRLHLAPPRPDFELKITPPSISIHAGRSAAVCAHVLRWDGFEGPVELSLIDPPPGFTLTGATIPPGRQSIRMTVDAPRDAGPALTPLRFAGTAEIEGVPVTHEATPAEDQMQAFLWRHLVPTRELIARIDPGRRALPGFEVACELPLRIPLGDSAELPIVTVGALPEGATVGLMLGEPPAGIVLREVTPAEGGLTAVIEAGESALPTGYADNLIVNIEMAFDRTDRDGNRRTWKTPIGSLAAVPFVIVAQ